MFNRRLEGSILPLLNEFRIVYISGPRQAGKTTIARHIAQKRDMRYLTLDDQATFASAESDPHGFIEALGDKPVVLDEFQYAPALIPAIKKVSDQLPPNKKGQFLLTGSADIFRSAKAQEALPGHMARLELLPLALSELNDRPGNFIDELVDGDLQEREPSAYSRDAIADLIIKGGYPEPYQMSPKSRKIWYSSYLEGRLYKDFETLYDARGDYHSKLSALTPYLAGICGNLLKYSTVSNELNLNDKVIKNYIEILELMFIVRRLPAYLKNQAKRLSAMPKIHFIDTGLACHLLGMRRSRQLLNTPHYGALFENFVLMELTKQATWSDESVNFYHFRTPAKKEVDIVMETEEGHLIGIEIKASSSVKKEDFRGMNTLAETVGNRFQYGIVIYTGERILPFKDNGHTHYAVPIGALIGSLTGASQAMNDRDK